MVVVELWEEPGLVAAVAVLVVGGQWSVGC